MLPALNIFNTFYGRVGAQGVGQAKAVIFLIIVALFSSLQFIRRKEEAPLGKKNALANTLPAKK